MKLFVVLVVALFRRAAGDMNHVRLLRSLQQSCDKDGDGFLKNSGKCGDTFAG